MSARIPSRRQAERPPLGAALRTLTASLVVTGGLCGWAVMLAPPSVRVLLAWGGGGGAVAFSAALATAVFQRRLALHYRSRIGDLKAEAERLADETLPALVVQLRDGASVDTALSRAAGPVAGAHRRILRTLAEEVGRGERMRAAAMSACANAAGRVQALATGMLADLREMEDRHGEEVLGDLMKLDHTTAQAGRLADSIAVLTGARSGRRWNKPIAMESILRGAMGRISAYRRIRLHNSSQVAIAGHAAEGIMHALAEIMDNATSFSPPLSPVHVYVEEAQAGVVVSVEDSGLVMSEAALQRAQQSVSAATLDLMSLSGTRLGLAVVGCLARKHGLNVSFRPSARGGTGVVVLIPQQLVTEARTPAQRAEPQPPVADTAVTAPRATVPAPRRAPEAEAERATATEPPAETPASDRAPARSDAPAPLPRRTPQPGAARPDAKPEAVPEALSEAVPEAAAVRRPDAEAAPQDPPAPAAPIEYGESGLPKRRRGQTLASAPMGTGPAHGRAPAADRSAARPARSREESAARFRAFRKAVQGTPGRDAADGPRTDAAPGLPAGGSPASPPAPSPARPEDETR
ncbi:ATP-binding protein [Streptomyces natalensis]|uniref:histidine kinase n=1 Tax=Streptomyces natalensis ATCC 27448 TaxID=1240678 RepID=A0A0D7CTB1_9ACTN|nr:ATP-binding protein [Streptomyces natalensis]KIZ19494.1 histidine kinase [Streptomyces natalensis ATCC 27448]